MYKQWRSAPQPLPLLFVLFVATLATNVALSVAGASPNRIVIFGFGAAAAAIGFAVLLDLRGCATHLSAYLKTERPHGVDYSRSYLSNPRFIRSIHLMIAAVGVYFALLAIFAKTL